ncbi:MAG: sodium:calcium antiporter [Aquificae bacterium]|nr:sodium:calcium antiporter [Aquificota bacterium]
MILWVEFFVLMLIVLFSGKNLVKYGDILAEKLNLGKTIIGLIFIASITSLPELITGISSVAIVESADLLAGDIFGSCMANLFMLVILDAFIKQQPLTTKVHHGFTLTASFGIVLIVVAVLSILMSKYIFSIKWVSLSSLIIIVIYIFALKVSTSYERRLLKKATHEIAQKLKYEQIPLKDVVFKYALNSVFIIFAATLLPERGEKIIQAFGLSETFFGSFFIAVTTSLPELAVSIASIKLGLVQIAVANLLGSNIFNVFIMAVSDFFFLKGSVYSYMSLSSVIPALFAVIMTCVVIIGLIYKVERKYFFIGNESILLAILYVLGIYLTYHLRL